MSINTLEEEILEMVSWKSQITIKSSLLKTDTHMAVTNHKDSSNASTKNNQIVYRITGFVK